MKSSILRVIFKPCLSDWIRIRPTYPDTYEYVLRSWLSGHYTLISRVADPEPGLWSNTDPVFEPVGSGFQTKFRSGSSLNIED